MVVLLLIVGGGGVLRKTGVNLIVRFIQIQIDMPDVIKFGSWNKSL